MSKLREPYSKEQLQKIGKQLLALIKARSPQINTETARSEANNYLQEIRYLAVDLLSGALDMDFFISKREANKILKKCESLGELLKHHELSLLLHLGVQEDSSKLMMKLENFSWELKEGIKYLKSPKGRNRNHNLKSFVNCIAIIFENATGMKFSQIKLLPFQQYKQKMDEFNSLLIACVIKGKIQSLSSLKTYAKRFLEKNVPEMEG